MDTDIALLEQHLEQLISLLETGKGEIRALHSRVAALEAENRVLAEKVRVAAERLESLVERIPET